MEPDERLMIIFILFITLLAYSYSWKCGIVSDDIDEFNRPRTLPKKFFSYPIRLSDYPDFLWNKLFGKHYGKWHLVAVGYHLVMVSLFYSFAKMYFGKEIATVAALIFALHPCIVQNVIWLSGRYYIIMGWMAVLGLIALKIGHIYPVFAVIGAVLHPQGAVIPILAFLLKPGLFTGLLTIGTGFLGPLYIRELRRRLILQNWPKQDTDWRWSRLNMMVKITNYYLFMALIPFKMGFYHAYLFGYPKAIDNFNLKVILGLITFAALGWVSLVLPGAGFGLAWFFLALLPCMNIIHSNMLFAERYMYLPLMGFALGLSQILSLIPHYPIILSVILTLYFVRTFSYSMAYTDEIKLFSTNIRTHPLSLEAHINLGDRWIKRDRADLAFPLFSRAIEIDPESDVAWFNLGVAQFNLRFVDDARKSWQRSLEINPKYVNPRFNLIRLEKMVQEQKQNLAWREIPTMEAVGVGAG
jgi:tetratricopeptide (TPR) repeat protein